ncbi:hypothetical protein EON65_32025 [archaeon]|nr:MAG: hypothetical protein EON65_32025 [archaeon]
MSETNNMSVESSPKVEARLEGLPKSGRFWKKKQVYRSSAQMRKGVLSHLSTTYEEKKAEKERLKGMKALEREMIDAKKQRKQDEKTKREEQQKRRMANEFKTTTFQVVSLPYFISSMQITNMLPLSHDCLDQGG